MKFNFVILTFNEDRHVRRCIESILPVSRKIFVVDSFSTDNTKEICSKFACVHFVENKFINQSQQFNWALDNLLHEGWVFRIDADEEMSEELVAELSKFQPQQFSGISINRHVIFRHNYVRYGGLYPHKLIRGFKIGCGRSEKREMDEHLTVTGLVKHFNCAIIDASEQSIDDWTIKHLNYSIREAYSYFTERHGPKKNDTIEQELYEHRSFRRLLKNKVFYKLPSGVRAFAYFIYRFIFRLGCLDYGSAFYFHCFQGFWYRMLVDFRIFEVQRYCDQNCVDYKTAFFDLYEFKRGV